MSNDTELARVGADVGGTFTDVILQRPNGEIAFSKVLSTPPHYDRAVVEGIRQPAEALGATTRIAEVVHGTTVATNAVLERRGSATALVTTAGFRDVLELRRVRMPALYNPFWDKPRTLVERHLRFEVDERMTTHGEVLRPLDDDEVRAVAARIRESGVQAVAVCFLHAHRHPEHEQRAGAVLRAELPDVAVSLSSEILREQREYERTAATVVNAYVRPLMREYLADIRVGLDESHIDAPVNIMQSSGGVMTSIDAAVRPVYALESGPAAGVIAAAGLGQRVGFENLIAFDMGGTTAKVSLIKSGRVARSREYEVGADLSAGSRLLRGSGELLPIPSVDIAEVGAGGGSLARLDAAGGLHVGPESSGADPGPACYGRGGTEPTVTDANVLLGYMPRGGLAQGDLLVSAERAEEAVARVASPLELSTIEAARGVHQLANAAMMRALRAVSSEKGRDPAGFGLVAYGGSGPVHAAALAEELAIRTVLVPPLAGLFSAAGLLYARTQYDDVRFCQVPADGSDTTLLRAIDSELRDALTALIGTDLEVEWRRSVDVRYKGQNWDMEVDFPGEAIDADALAKLVERFEAEHERTYGVRSDPGSPVEIRALRLSVLGPEPTVPPIYTSNGVHTTGATATRRADFGDGQGGIEVDIRTRHDIGADPVAGPLLIDEYDTTVVVRPNWTVRRDEGDTLVLERAAEAQRIDLTAEGQARVESSDPVTQGIVANALASIADEMATTIFRTAHSTIVRDAMDFSAALCGPTGETIAQAVTIPLHLGSIPIAMDALLAEYGSSMRPGDIFIMNDPFAGGMHTSDIYIVKPVFVDGTLVGYAVAIAHHGDVGGRVPGTTACDNTEVFQEGLRLPWLPLYSAGEPVEEMFKVIRANVRIPRMTLGDIRAQVAACTVAERALQALAARYVPDRLCEIMTGLLDYTERLVRSEIAEWPDGTVSFTDYLGSDGIDVCDVAINVELTVRGDTITADFSQSAPMVRGALNCTHSFTAASVYHAVMSAVVAPIPSTAGAFRPINVVTKPGTVVDVALPGASSMRGVTGERCVDVVNGALAQLIPHRVPAAGEGGNMLGIFSGLDSGGERFIYYELVTGTWGARPGADGNDGLSNPCATGANIPVEVAESEFPILIERYGLVPDSGGAGQYRGGLAIERAWRALAPETTLQVRSDRQTHPPYGLSGGDFGAPSENTLSTGSDVEPLPPMFSTVLQSGTVYSHRMPGGGGWGDPLDREPHDVARDVLDEKVSREAAREMYGVVIEADGGVDVDGTTDLRASLRARRKEG